MKYKLEDLLGRPVIQLDDTAIDKLVRGGVALVTGAAGSIGRELVYQLVNHGLKEIILLDQAESALHELILTLHHELADELNKVKLTSQLASITDERRMHEIFTMYHPEFVFHTAAYKHVPLMEDHPYEALTVNVLGTKTLADLSVAFSVKKFVLVSTDKAVNPTSVMGATKRLAEMYVQSLNSTSTTNFITTRFGNVLGSAGSVVPLFKRQIDAGGPVTVTHPDIIRYFMTVSEACQLVLEAAAMGTGGEVFVFDMGQPIRIVDLARQLIQLSGYEVDIGIALHFTGLRPGEKLYEELLSKSESTLLTYHLKIKIARLHPPEAHAMQQAMHRLRLTLIDADNITLVYLLQELVPEYVSTNALYMNLEKPQALLTNTKQCLSS